MFIVFDLDNTLRSTAGSEHLVPDDVTLAKNWLPWQEYISKHGKPIPQMVSLYESLCQSNDVLILTSGQFGTKEWLEFNRVSPCPTILERPRDENRSSFDFKRQWVDENAHQISLWVDDHVKMCDYVESLGIPVIRVTPRLTGNNNNNGIH